MKWEHDDGGRSDANFKGEAGDCVARAIAIAAELPYADVYAAMAEVNYNARSRSRTAGKRSARNGVLTKTRGFKRYMAALGFEWTPTMQIGSGCKVHLRADELPPGRLVVAVSKHLCAVIDGVLHDTHDCSRDGTRCVYGYWKREEAE